MECLFRLFIIFIALCLASMSFGLWIAALVGIANGDGFAAAFCAILGWWFWRFAKAVDSIK